ncbi:MAG: type II toxin-antitoxin system death-on-curing family toxin [Solirubrobacteraceae bacterium]
MPHPGTRRARDLGLRERLLRKLGQRTAAPSNRSQTPPKAVDAAVHRPRTSVLGQDAYPDLFAKAAALLHSLARNHPLVDGNKRLAWLATYVFLAKNDVVLDPDDDEAYELVVAVAAGRIDEVSEIAAALASFAGRAPD